AVGWWLLQSEADDHWNDNSSWGISAQYDYDLDWATATVVYGHRAMNEKKNYIVPLSPSLVVPNVGSIATNPGVQHEVWFSRTDGAPNSILATDMKTSGHFNSLEARIASNSTIAAGDEFEWIAGAMHMDDVVSETVQITENVYTKTTTKESALFGQVSWMPVNKLNLTAGYRYTWDKKDYTGHNYGLGPLIPGQYYQRVGIPIDPADFESTSHKHGEGTYKANISYSFTDSLMSYIQYARGYKTFNIDRDGNKIDPEFMDSWELGFKSRLLENRLQVNMSSYYYEYENYNNWYAIYRCAEGYEPTERDPGTCRSINFATDYAEYINVPLAPGGTEQYGINANIIWLISPNDTFTASASYSKNKYDNYDIASAMEAVMPGSDSAKTPDYQVRNYDVEGIRPLNANFGYTRTFYIGTDTLMLTGNAFYKGESVDQVLHRNTPYQYSMSPDNAYWLFDASVSYNSSKWVPEGVSWNLRLWCNNIFDSDELATRSFSDTTNVYTDYSFLTQVGFAPGSGIITGTYVTPRTYGVTLGVNF
ncbi:MAG: TonB-dependent receptor, partial [Desulfobacteraceae bacterium]